MIERTFVAIKPDGVERALVGEIIKRFENVGLKIVGMKMVWIDENLGKKHYHDIVERRGQAVFDSLMKFMTSGPVIAMALEGVGAVELVRKMVGATESKSAAPGTIRGDFSHHSYAFADQHGIAIKNVIHASGAKDEAEYEVSLWFKDDELHTYKTVHEMHTMK